MLSRRRIAGLLALFAFVLSYSEALAAAACSMGGATEMAIDMPMPMPMPADGHDSDVPQDDCPLSMPGSPTNCIFSSAVPSAVANKLIHAGIRPIVTATDQAHYQLLLVHTAFHPPKA